MDEDTAHLGNNVPRREDEPGSSPATRLSVGCLTRVFGE